MKLTGNHESIQDGIYHLEMILNLEQNVYCQLFEILNYIICTVFFAQYNHTIYRNNVIQMIQYFEEENVCYSNMMS